MQAWQIQKQTIIFALFLQKNNQFKHKNDPNYNFIANSPMADGSFAYYACTWSFASIKLKYARI